MSNASSEIARVRLGPGREKAPLAGHPWIFSGSIAETSGPPTATLARVESADGRDLGVGFFSPHSRIRVRMLGNADLEIDRGFFRRRLEAAIDLRRDVVGPGTDGYRVANAEGDGLPGWTVDRFGDVLVSQMTVAGLDERRDEAYAALSELFPGAAILHAGNLAARRAEGLPTSNEWVRGTPRGEARFRESGLTLFAELGGQKTGFYCDQRESRRRVESLARGRSILDLCAHTGAFSLYALRGGATRAVLVESAARLLATAERQLSENGCERSNVELTVADVFEDLRHREERFGLVVCDPPPLARRRSEVERAARAYKDLNRLALRRVEPGGFFLTFTCSAAVDAKLFRQILFAAATEAGARLQLLAPLGAAPDHPVAVAHPEGEYLKGWLGRVVAFD